MKILGINSKTGTARLKITTPEDLWLLQKVLGAGDIVTGKSSYKQKIGDEDGRQKAVRKTITITLVADKVSFDNFVLRVHGAVQSSSLSEISLDESHSIEIVKGSEITIKKEWKKYQLEILKDAERSSNLPKALVCLIDDSEANFGEVTASGIKSFYNKKLSSNKKRYEDKKEDEMKAVAEDLIKEMHERGIELILIASPLFFKDELKKRVLEIMPGIGKKLITETVSTGSAKGFREIMLKPAFTKIVSEAHYIKEEKEIENLLGEISKNSGLAEYGLEEVEGIIESGTVKNLLVLEDLFKSQFKRISVIVSKAEENGAIVIIFDSERDAGKKLKGLGGIAVLLRYKV